MAVDLLVMLSNGSTAWFDQTLVKALFDQLLPYLHAKYKARAVRSVDARMLSRV